jgi:hypothetical protein
MSKNIQSQICIEVSSHIRSAGKEILQKLYITDLYVYIEIAGKRTIYLPEKYTMTQSSPLMRLNSK